MKIIKREIEDLMVQINYKLKDKENDRDLNKRLNYYFLLEEKEKELQELVGLSLECILYSKYYWFTKYKEKCRALYGMDAGIEQQQYKIIEEISQRLIEVKWELIEEIENENNN